MEDAPSLDGLTFRQDYFCDPVAWAGLVDLLRDTFSIDVGLQDEFGGPDPTSMPLGYFDEAGQCVANFSAFSMPVIIAGRSVNAAGFQSGAVRPEWRGKGLYRDLMRRAFARIDEEGFELSLLLTDKPSLYEPYGFRTKTQHRFVGEAPSAISGMALGTMLRLPQDVALIQDLLQARTAVSQRFAVARQMEMFLLNACFDPDIQLMHLPKANAVVAWKMEGSCLRLLDVVGAIIPDIATIIGALGLHPLRVEVFFPPDLLGWEGEAVAYTGYTKLMVRGGDMSDFPQPIMLSPMAEF